MTCEVCDDETPAIGEFKQTWHDGTLDAPIALCALHAESDPDGMWRVEKYAQ